MRVSQAAAAILALVFFAHAAPAQAQTFRGAIRGIVSDATGAVLPGVSITVKNSQTGLERTFVTDEDGVYIAPELPIGDYAVTASLAGFKSQTVEHVTVEVAIAQRIDLQLAVGNFADIVTVTAGQPMVQRTGDTLGGTITAADIAVMPINGRDFTKLLVLVPGAAGDPSAAGDSPGSFGLVSVNGSRGRSNNYLLDGTDMNDGYRNLPAINQGGVFGTPATVLPVDALAEVRIIASGEAEYGRNSGAIVNIVTKSGTNQLTGSAYEYFRDDRLDSRNAFNPEPLPKNDFRNQQFGGSLGGPIVKDKTFYFASYEGQRERVGLPATSRVPSPADLARATNPVIQRLVARSPWPAPNVAGAGADEANLISTTNATNRVDSLIGKIDQRVGAADILTTRYFFGDSDQSFPLALLGGNVLPGYNTVTPTNVQIVSASYGHVVSPRLLVELRGGYNRFHEDFFPEDGSFDPGTIGLNTVTNPQDFGLPLMRVAGYAPIGANASVPRGRVDVNTQAFANVSYTAGRHTMKAGYEFRRTDVDGFFDAGYRGVLNFDSLDDFLAGRVSGGRQAIGDSGRQTFQNNHSLYAQDGFAIARGLTLNAGLRWDYYGVLGEKQDRLSALDPARGLLQVGTMGLDRLYPRDWNNLAPRLNLAYDITGNGRWVARAGWGLYFDAFSQDFFVGQLPFNTFNSGPAYNGVGPSPIAFSFSPAAAIVPGQPVFDASSFSASDVFTVDPHLVTPYVHNFNLNIEHQVGDHAAVQVAYVGSGGRHLFRYRDINQADPRTGARPFDAGPFAPDGSAFFYVNQFESTATSHYHGLQTSATVRRWRGLSMTADYTFSQSRDNASDGQDYVPNAAQPDDSFNPEGERANSNFDVRHRLTAFFTYALPSKGGAWTKGWSLDGVLTLASGMPFNVNYLFEGDFNGSGEFFGRPDLVGDPFAGTSGADRFLNLSAFAVPCAWDAGVEDCRPGSGHFGNVGRNAFRGPGYANFDLSIVKKLAAGPRANLELRLDIFNLLNRTNLASPLLPTFGVDFLANGIDPATGRGVAFLPITATPDVAIGNPFLGGGGPRNLQIAAKLTF
jgi:hypothetical protein